MDEHSRRMRALEMAVGLAANGRISSEFVTSTASQFDRFLTDGTVEDTKSE